MKAKLLAGLVGAMMCLISCDDNTDNIGSSMTDNADLVDIATDTFSVTSQSVAANAVLARNNTGYIGQIKDPETSNYVTGDFLTQFYSLPVDSLFPKKSNVVSKDDEGLIAADSCEIRLFFTSFYGDSLAQMKLSAYELDKPIDESKHYKTDFDPIAEGYISEASRANRQDVVYTLCDMTEYDSVRTGSSYTRNIRVPMNKAYTKDGKTYKNFGTYVMRQYYEHPEYFKNTYLFTKNVCPGFYIQHKQGVGSMAYISIPQLNVYFKYQYQYVDTADSDKVKWKESTGVTTFSGTEEVLQATHISNDSKLEELAAETEWTYLKSPAGIYTELTLPVEDIMRGHENDTLNTAKLVLSRINNKTNSKYALPAPTTVLMLPADSVETFFANNRIADYKRSFLATYSSSLNSYTFNNISGIVSAMHAARKNGETSEKWNKVAVIPVSTTYTTVNNQSVLVKVVHDMSMTSARLVGGANNAYAEDKPLKISIIYSKFK